MWKNSFMDNLPLSDNMRYYSGYYKPCTSITNRGWCNVPKKADKFSPKEQMIVAYHNTHVVYAYKGLFNRNIDYDWTGGILLDFKKIVDKCGRYRGTHPAPAVTFIPGITFDKLTPSTTMPIVPHFMDHCQSLQILAGMTVFYHHLFQTQIFLFK